MATKIEKAMAKVFKAAQLREGEEPYIRIHLLKSGITDKCDYTVHVAWFDKLLNIHPVYVDATHKSLDEAVELVLAKLEEVNLDREKV